MEKMIPTTCTRDCPDACSILVTVRDGEIISQKADVRNPYTRNYLCAKGNNYLARYSSAHRLLRPMLRRGENFSEISWDQALDLAAEKLTRTRTESGPLSTLWAQYSGSLSLLNLIIPRIFWIHMGGSTMTAGGISIDALQAAQMNDFGACLLHEPEDMLNSRNIVIWGKNPLITNVHLIPFIREAQKKGAQVTVIDPRYSETADMANRHIAPRPGGDGYLAMAVAKEVLRRQEKESDFVHERATGWDGYRALLDRYDDETLRHKADVTEEEVSYLASAYWDQRPCATYMGLGVNWWKQGGAHSRLIHSLVFVSGNVGIPGGGANFFSTGFAFGTQVFREEMARAAQRGVEPAKPRRILVPLLAKEIEKVENPAIRLAWIAMFNPVAAAPDSNHLKKVLGSLDFVIVTEQFMTATALCADLVLPVTTYLEEEDVIGSHGHFYVGPVNPVGPPRGESHSNLWIFQKLADRMGFGKALAGSPWDWISRAWAPLAEQGISMEEVKKGPVKRKLPAIPYRDGTFRTQDGRFQLITDYEGRAEPGPGFTLLMVKTRTFLNSQLLPEEAESIPVICLNPAVMTGLKIKDGDRVLVRSSLDELEAIAKSSARTRPDVVEMIPSQWKNDGGGINRLREAIVSDMGPTAAVNETRVTIHGC